MHKRQLQLCARPRTVILPHRHTHGSIAAHTRGDIAATHPGAGSSCPAPALPSYICLASSLLPIYIAILQHSYCQHLIKGRHTLQKKMMFWKSSMGMGVTSLLVKFQKIIRFGPWHYYLFEQLVRALKVDVCCIGVKFHNGQ